MIEKMTKYSWILPSADRDGFLEQLRSFGVVDIQRSSKPVDDKSQGYIDAIEEKKYLLSCLEKGSDKELEELKSELTALRKEAETAAVWGDYDKARLDAFGIRYYCVPEKRFDPLWEEQYPIQIVQKQKGNVWFVTVGTDDFPERETRRPDRTEAEIERETKKIESAIQEKLRSLESERKSIPTLKEEISGLQSDLSLYLASIKGDEAAEGHLAIYEGFAPESEDRTLAEKFDGMAIVWTSEKASVEDNPPIKLRNNGFASQFETLTGMYGFPVYNEFDPTPILAPFFLLFFSLCMGDAGYGILLVTIAHFLKGMNTGLSSFWKLIRFLGIGTFVVGLFLGTFFGISLFEAAWVPQWLKNCMIVEGNVGKIAGFDPQIVLVLAIGIFHICLAMVVKTACVTRQSGFKNNLSTWGWTLLVVGGVITGALAIGGLLGGEALKWTVIAIGAVSAIGIFILNKPGRNPLFNIGAGLWDSYNMATGILGDTLSYIRLYALGLAGGMLGNAFNNLASMMVNGGNATWQWIPFAVIVLIGHGLNLAMSCLGAFVHPLRLTFVEYFKNSGYEGRGLKYNPLKK